ncbi:MAG: hypothetical protein OXC44_02390 [Proteobacteria bacterium]|nr:hypothetical protein [Pseudomonadota bacterium]
MKNKKRTIKKTLPHKKLSVTLLACIIFAPIIFAWFTLQKGYPKSTRNMSFIWMVLSSAIIPTKFLIAGLMLVGIIGRYLSWNRLNNNIKNH